MSNTIEVKGEEWSTPLTRFAGRSVGGARLHRSSYSPGYYHMEGTYGAELLKIVGGRLPVIELQRKEPNAKGGWKTWMVDDPLHWYAMRELVEALPPGRLLCAGLGLGLMLHHLVKRTDIQLVDVIELDADVISLIKPTLPERPDLLGLHWLTLINADFYNYLAAELRTRTRPYDAILWDLAVGEKRETLADFHKAAAMVAAYAPGVPLFRFGERRPR